MRCSSLPFSNSTSGSFPASAQVRRNCSSKKQLSEYSLVQYECFGSRASVISRATSATVSSEHWSSGSQSRKGAAWLSGRGQPRKADSFQSNPASLSAPRPIHETHQSPRRPDVALERIWMLFSYIIVVRVSDS